MDDHNPIELANKRLTVLHHQFYPHLGPEDFYQNILADLMHFEDLMMIMGISEEKRLALRVEAKALYNLDRAVVAQGPLLEYNSQRES